MAYCEDEGAKSLNTKNGGIAAYRFIKQSSLVTIVASLQLRTCFCFPPASASKIITINPSNYLHHVLLYLRLVLNITGDFH
jgi:hypothetical protein